MNYLKMLAACFLLTVAAAASERVSEKGTVQCTYSTPAAALAGAAPCAECPTQCESHVSACKDGSVKACYLAAACLCQCNLDAGGCGSDKEALRQCVNDNRKNARELER